MEMIDKGSDELLKRLEGAWTRILSLRDADRERQREFSLREDRAAAEAGGRHVGETADEG